MTRSDALITADELLSRLASTPAPRLLDVRWTLPKPDGRDDFAAGHIPGAIYVDLDTELADHGSTELRGLGESDVRAIRWNSSAESL